MISGHTGDAGQVDFLEVKQFSDGEICVNLGETVRGVDCFVIQSTSNPVNDNLMELLITIDAMKRASAGRITAVVPYYGYARQDRKAKARDPITAKLVADMIVKAGQNVLVGKYSGSKVKLDDQEYTIVRQGDILAIVE